MPLRFLRNPLGAVGSFVRRVVRLSADQIRDPLTRVLNPEHLLGIVGRQIGSVGRAFAQRGAALEAEALRRRARREAEAAIAAGEVHGIPPDAVIDDDLIPESVSKIRRQYAWTVRVHYLDPNTGDVVDRYLTISTDTRMSHREVLAAATEMVSEEYGISSQTTVEMTVDRVVKAGQQGTL